MLYKNYIKRPLDLVISIIAFLLFSPVFMIITLLLFIANNGKPFFLQSRPGFNGLIFKVIKFKTMNDKRGRDGKLLSDAERMTTIGKIVRKTSLDEVPQLLNVIKGDMSLIGPRPLLIDYLPLYNEQQSRRHEVRPGITGWAQVNGRNAISWRQKFEYDTWYIDNLSIALDGKILWMTLLKVVRSEGISSPTTVTMERFTGN
jgi:undecaprenyl phosphate N,N'-diacetylbacillosamine 1-phosphate transferase